MLQVWNTRQERNQGDLMFGEGGAESVFCNFFTGVELVLGVPNCTEESYFDRVFSITRRVMY